MMVSTTITCPFINHCRFEDVKVSQGHLASQSRPLFPVSHCDKANPLWEGFRASAACQGHEMDCFSGCKPCLASLLSSHASLLLHFSASFTRSSSGCAHWQALISIYYWLTFIDNLIIRLRQVTSFCQASNWIDHPVFCWRLQVQQLHPWSSCSASMWPTDLLTDNDDNCESLLIVKIQYAHLSAFAKISIFRSQIEEHILGLLADLLVSHDLFPQSMWDSHVLAEIKSNWFCFSYQTQLLHFSKVHDRIRKHLFWRQP